MKFAHLADLHLGYRQYGLYERLEDYNRAFEKAVEEVIERDLSFVLISGDLFHCGSPPAVAVRSAFKGLSMLKGAGIPVVAIRGNHDGHFERGGNYLSLLEDAGLLTYLEGERFYTDLEADGERARILGIGCLVESQLVERLESVKKAIDPSADHNILMLHQSFDKVSSKDRSWLVHSAYFYDDAFGHVDYFALGHVHERCKHPEFPAYYPGSIEYWDIDDAETHIFDMKSGRRNFKAKKGKGFLAVELDDGIRVEPVEVEGRRVVHLIFEYGEIDPRVASEEIAEILPEFDEVGSLVVVTVRGVVKEGCRASDLDFKAFRKALGNVLKLKTRNELRHPSALAVGRIEGRVTPERAIEEYFSALGEEGKGLSRLAIRLFEYLSRNDVEGAKEVVANDL